MSIPYQLPDESDVLEWLQSVIKGEYDSLEAQKALDYSLITIYKELHANMQTMVIDCRLIADHLPDSRVLLLSLKCVSYTIFTECLYNHHGPLLELLGDGVLYRFDIPGEQAMVIIFNLAGVNPEELAGHLHACFKSVRRSSL